MASSTACFTSLVSSSNQEEISCAQRWVNECTGEIETSLCFISIDLIIQSIFCRGKREEVELFTCCSERARRDDTYLSSELNDRLCERSFVFSQKVRQHEHLSEYRHPAIIRTIVHGNLHRSVVSTAFTNNITTKC